MKRADCLTRILNATAQMPWVGGEVHTVVQHDDYCSFNVGDGCDCTPDISMHCDGMVFVVDLAGNLTAQVTQCPPVPAFRFRRSRWGWAPNFCRIFGCE